MASRQVQKLSAPGPARSAKPSMKRWWAWEWTLGMAGTAMPEMRSPPSLSPTWVIMPLPSTVTVTSRFQPSGVNTLAK